MQVREIMTRGAELADPGVSLKDAARRMRDEDVGALPVGENDRLVGMVTDRDIVTRAVAEDAAAGEQAVRDVMSDHVYCCFEDDEVETAARKMADHQVRRLPVLDRDRRLVGMLALADLGRSGAEAARDALGGVSEATGQPRRARVA